MMKRRYWTVSDVNSPRSVLVYLGLVSLLVGLAGGCDFLGLGSSNQSPNLKKIELNTDVAAGGKVWASAVATDPDGDSIRYQWSVTEGEVLSGVTDDRSHGPTSNPTLWHTPATPGQYRLKCTVSDGRATDSTSKVFSLELSETVVPDSFNVRQHRYNSSTHHSRQNNETDWRSDFSYVTTIESLQDASQAVIYLKRDLKKDQAPLRIEESGQTLELNADVTFNTSEVSLSGYLAGTNPGEDHTIRDDSTLHLMIYTDPEYYPDSVTSGKIFQR